MTDTLTQFLAPPVRPSTEWLRQRIERRQQAYLWGQKYFITPRLVDEAFGDGQTLIHLTPLNTRPNYYVVRVDSRWGESAEGLNDEFRDTLDDIYESIEDQYGRAIWWDEEDEDEDDREQFPAFDDECGTCWGEMEWPEDEKQPRLFDRWGRPTRAARVAKRRGK
jgi:hypothetical protein